MFKYSVIAFVTLFCFYITELQCERVDVPVSTVCLGCLCGAASRCDTEMDCVGDRCGPYRFTWDYWVKGGSLTFNKLPTSENTTFVKCATNYFCSGFTVQRYMDRYKRDCNGDGMINCDDYAALHFLGPDNCNASLPEEVKGGFETCKFRYTY